MALILEIEESKTELISGIPQYLTISTNKPSNVFYTLDGSTPNSSSLIAASRVDLPTEDNSFVFKCRAYDGSEYSSEFSKEYKVTSASSNIKNTRKGHEEGVVVLEYDQAVKDSFGFDAEQEIAQEMSKVRNSYDFVTSTTNDEGEPVPSTKTFINFVKEQIIPARQGPDSPNNDNVYFDPRAQVIMIDGLTQGKINDQSVRLINRPFGTFNYVSEFYTENESKYKNIISGNLTKYAYDSTTGEITFYYYESLECRWIISKQKVEPKSFNFGKTPKNRRGGKFVFQWIKDPVMSKLR